MASIDGRKIPCEEKLRPVIQKQQVENTAEFLNPP